MAASLVRCAELLGWELLVVRGQTADPSWGCRTTVIST